MLPKKRKLDLTKYGIEGERNGNGDGRTGEKERRTEGGGGRAEGPGGRVEGGGARTEQNDPTDAQVELRWPEAV